MSFANLALIGQERFSGFRFPKFDDFKIQIRFIVIMIK